jgi:hypothetical protein
MVRVNNVIDTNIFVYSFDGSQPEKKQQSLPRPFKADAAFSTPRTGRMVSGSADWKS